MPEEADTTWQAWLPRLLARLHLREHQIFLALTIIIGLAAGLSAVLFHLAVASVGLHLFGLSPSAARLILIPALMGLPAGYLMMRYFPETRGSGVPQTEVSFHLSDGIIKFRTAVGKFITGVLSIGGGHSMGPEGPSVQIGAALASSFGRWFRLSPTNVRNLVPVGAAAGLAAAFNTPIAAVLFALEQIVGDMNAAVMGSTVLASVASVVVERAILGNEPLFSVPAYSIQSPVEFVAYAALGVVGGFVSVAFCKGLLRARQSFLNLPRWTLVYQPAVGGLVLGLVLLVDPRVRSVGYEWVDVALRDGPDGFALKILILLGVMKIVATIISFASGNSGGIFAPSLFIGAMIGGATGSLMQHAPFAVGDPGAYALVGMGTVFAGILRVPMTSVFMIFEITQDYEIVLPLMIAIMISYTISRRFQPDPVFRALLQQDGIHLPAPGARAAAGRWRVREMMSREFKKLPLDATVGQAWEAAREWPGQCFPVLKGELLEGMVTREALEEALARGERDRPLAELNLWRDSAHVHSDQPLEIALERLSRTPGLLPVVSRLDSRRMDGVVSLEDVLKAFAYSRRF